MENNLGNKIVLAKNLQRYMEQYGYTAKDIAEKIGVEPSAVSYWVNAKYYPRIDKIEKMANLFHVNKACLVEEQDSYLVLKSRQSHLNLSHEETSLLSSWEQATFDEQMQIYYVLKKYGMTMPNEKNATATSVS